MEKLTLKNLTLSYAEKTVLRELNLKLKAKEFHSLLGPSGTGKTTILKAIAGLLQPDSGEIILDGNRIEQLPTEKRDIVMVFQNALLFPFLNVEENIAFGLKMRGKVGESEKKKIKAMMELTGLEKLGRRRASQLSGGEQQRVSLARALVLEPSVLLLDEPLSNLDANLRQQMRDLIKNIHKETGVTSLMVTHDQSEAMMISDKITFLTAGEISQSGTPHDLYYRPQNLKVANFFNTGNFIDGALENNKFTTKYGIIPLADIPFSGKATATIRPENIKLFYPEELVAKSDFRITGIIDKIQFEGSLTRIEIKTDNGNIFVLNANKDYKLGKTVNLALPIEKLWFIPDTGII